MGNRQKKVWEKIRLPIAVLLLLVCIYAPFYVVDFDGLFTLIQTEVTQKEIDKNPRKDYRGYKAGDDIERLISKNQDITFGDYITIETDTVIPIQLYRIKDEEKASYYQGGTMRHNAVHQDYAYEIEGKKAFDQLPKYKQREYFQYYLVELEDGSYVAAFIDQYYINEILKGKKVTLPASYFWGDTHDYIEEMEEQYDILDLGVLYMGRQSPAAIEWMMKCIVALVITILVYRGLKKIVPELP